MHEHMAKDNKKENQLFAKSIYLCNFALTFKFFSVKMLYIFSHSIFALLCNY